MPNFATGLAHGLFGAINDQNQQAKEREDATRKNTLTMLGSMLDQVDDDSKPLLFQQMAEVAGLKGKHRGLWDELTGRGRNEVTDAINQKYGDVMGSLVGPGQMDQLRSHAMQVQAPGPGPEGIYETNPELLQLQTPDMSKGKIGLKSALGDKMKEEAAKIKLQQTYLNQRLADREASVSQRQQELEDLRQANRKELEDQKTYNKAFGDVYKRAAQNAAKYNRKELTQEDLAVGADSLAAEQGLNADKLKAMIGVDVAKKGYFEAQAQAAGQNAGGVRPGQQATLDQAQQQNAQAVHRQWLEAKAKTEKSALEADQLRGQLEGFAKKHGMYFDSRDNSFRVPGGGLPEPYSLQGMALEDAKGILQKYLEAMANRVQFESEQRGHYNVIKSNYPDYFEVGDEKNPYVKPNAKFGGVAPFGAARTGGGGGGAVYDATGPYTGPSGKPGNVAEGQLIFGTKDRPASSMKVGQLVNQGGLKYRVKAIVPASEDQPFGAVQLEAVK